MSSPVSASHGTIAMLGALWVPDSDPQSLEAGASPMSLLLSHFLKKKLHQFVSSSLLSGFSLLLFFIGTSWQSLGQETLLPLKFKVERGLCSKFHGVIKLASGGIGL